MFQVAVYGKGGIGKSTISANTSAALAGLGSRVMQVGCDPKHDSTRLLLGGRSQRTVLDYVREVPIGRRRLEDVMETGTNGVLCVEAGGPEPGIGCAGRGILTTFEVLEKLGANDMDLDYRIYDVLGDVVCGGFAVPLRRDNADAVIIVTSGEFMALYAANNIMRGMHNFDTGSPRLLGIVFNARGGDDERGAVFRFAEATGTEIIAEIPRDPLFAEAEACGRTLVEMEPRSDTAEHLRDIAKRIESASKGDARMFRPVPLDDDQLSDLAAGRAIRPGSGAETPRTCSGCRTTIRGTRIMSSCAAYGAVSALMRASGSSVIVHGPESCMYLMCTTYSKAVTDLYASRVFEGAPWRDIRSTRMDDSSAIFGGNGFLIGALEDSYASGSRRMSVVTTCMPAIIGDDVESVVSGFLEDHPDASVEVIRADGDIAGEYTDGFMLAAKALVDRMDLTVSPEKGYVNLVSTSFFDLQSRRNMEGLRHMLAVFGLEINCRFIDDDSPAPVELFCRASTDIMMNDTRNTREIMGVVTERTGRKPFPAVLPVGFHDYVEWVRRMGEFTGRTDDAEREVARAGSEYRGLVELHRPRMQGVRMMVVWKMGSNPDWLLDTLNDLGVEVLLVGFFPSARKTGGKPDSRYDVVSDYSEERLARDLAEMRPDLLISDIARDVPEGVHFARLMRVGTGYSNVFDYIGYLEGVMRLPESDGWRCVR